MTNLLKAALFYARHGCSVIPVRQDKKPFIKWTPYQEKAASEDQIRAWWKKSPNANIGIVTGSVSGIDIVDVDSEAGQRALNEFLPDNLETPIARTPSGGWHYYFKHRAGLVNRSRALRDIDIRTTGGYAIAPPSKTGKANYAFLPGCKFKKDSLAKMPEKVFRALQENCNSTYKKKGTRGGSTLPPVHTSPHLSTDVHKLFSEGSRDQSIFHIANHLVKGGMPQDNIQNILTFIASKCSPPFPEKEVAIKIQSALNRADSQKRSLAEDVRDFVLSTSGHFLSTEVHNCLQVSTRQEKKAISMALARQVDEGIIERTGNRNGQFRRIETDCEQMDFLAAETETVPLWLPFKIHELVETMPGNTILLAGDQNAGKTGMLLNIIQANMGRFQIHYFNSEMGASELKKRLSKFAPETSLNEWKFNAYERSDKFADVIKSGRGKINIIDFLEIHDNFYEVGGMLSEIHRKLKGAIAIVALQKNPGSDVGLGGFRSLEKPRLALSMGNGYLKIVKGKNWVTDRNPNGLQVNFKIVQGCNFIQTKGWHHPK